MKKEGASSLAGNIASIAIAAGIFFFFFFFLGFFKMSLVGLLISAGLSLASYIGSVIMFGLNKSEKEKEIAVDLGKQGISAEMVAQAIGEGRKKTREIQAIGVKVKSPTVKKKIAAIVDVCERIFADFEKDPKDIKVARQFLQYYLDATIKILARYSDLEGHSGVSKEMAATLAKVESLLDNIIEAFEKQLAKLLEDDVLDLDVEMDLLEKTIKMNG